MSLKDKLGLYSQMGQIRPIQSDVADLNKAREQFIESTKPEPTKPDADDAEKSFHLSFTEGDSKGNAQPTESPRSTAINSAIHECSEKDIAKDTEGLVIVVEGEGEQQHDEASNGKPKDGQNRLTPLDFSHVSDVEGPWNIQHNKKNKRNVGKSLQITFEGNGSKGGRSVTSSSPPGKHLIKGARREDATTLYVRNISTEDRADDDICKDLRAYGQAVGLRIMNVEVVKNRYCQDVVGCRIKVPTSQVEKATSVELWPNEVECRKWAPKRRNTGYGASRW